MVEDILSGLKHYVFADTENDANNIPSFVAFLSEHKLFSKDSQIVCIIGADKSQKEYYEKLKKEVIKSANQKVVHITPIQITDVGTDALDKVLIAICRYGSSKITRCRIYNYFKRWWLCSCGKPIA